MQPDRSRLIHYLPLSGAGAAGLLVALVAMLVPGPSLEAVVEGSGIAALLPVAAPPLGTTARAVLALGGGLAVAAVSWAALYLLFGPGGPFAARKRPGQQFVRRADAHPDAPPRRPLSAAAELAAPPEPAAVVAEQPLPADLDVPLAAFDPTAVLPMPREPARSLKPLAPVLAPGERMETFALAKPVRSTPIPTTDAPPTIDALLRRLEQGARRRAAG
jgi:hypothetical protein